jgi:hypothetical protein
MVLAMNKQTAKIALLVSFIAFTMAVAVNAFSATLREEVTEKVTVSGETVLHVKNARGETIIVGKEGIREIYIEASKIVKTKNEEEAKKLMKLLTFEVERDGDEIRIVARHPDSDKEKRSIWSFFKGLHHRTAIDFTIEIPKAFDVKVTSTSGDVQISSIDGDAKIYGTSGDLRVSRIGGSSLLELTSGDVEIKDIGRRVEVKLSSGSAFIDGAGENLILTATSGNVEAYKIGGNAEVKLVSGDLTLVDCKGDLNSVSSSGDMVIKNIGGSVSVSSSSGDVEIFLTPAEMRTYNLATCSGDVNVYYLNHLDLGFLLDINTMSGAIEGDMEIKLDQVSRRHLKGIVGNGKSELVITTASGDVSINQGKKGK